MILLLTQLPLQELPGHYLEYMESLIILNSNNIGDLILKSCKLEAVDHKCVAVLRVKLSAKD